MATRAGHGAVPRWGLGSPAPSRPPETGAARPAWDAHQPPGPGHHGAAQARREVERPPCPEAPCSAHSSVMSVARPQPEPKWVAVQDSGCSGPAAPPGGGGLWLMSSGSTGGVPPHCKAANSHAYDYLDVDIHSASNRIKCAGG